MKTRIARRVQAALASGCGLGGSTFAFFCGTRIVAPHDLHRTFLPREAPGTARMRLHVRFGHMMRMCSGGLDG